MKIQLTLKTPDLDRVLEEYNPDYMDEEDITHEVMNDWIAIKGTFNKFVKYSEYVRVELDTETGTARVLEV